MASFTIKKQFKVSAKTLYESLLDSTRHSEMTGGTAECSQKENESFTAWDGYISGQNLRLIPHQQVMQSWRTTEFDDKDSDSILEIEFNENKAGCEMIIKHSHIPDGQSDYKKGWEEHYFEPMTEYFE
ncbi:SRPBCC domain-containing protein [Salibacteraceae bacterium]|nr:SRPBCC domain-containing protein [Salibacteraceae bacterium]MDB4104182.1 SRPBCC domain-containing protein [Salibacteraceae bacterium]MDC1220122.1 SRPBCC domain-containing protein [bacterium]MDC1304895.1 SRPBCC domain-containing protein [Salibacteraceae bacterium]